MTIQISVQGEDFYGNKIYFIFENGYWYAMNQRGIHEAFSNFSSNSAELHIALANCESKSGAISAINKYADYLKKNSIKERRENG
jgi:hypothetical protein